jgi:outer membrane autotransporter protein
MVLTLATVVMVLAVATEGLSGAAAMAAGGTAGTNTGIGGAGGTSAGGGAGAYAAGGVGGGGTFGGGGGGGGGSGFIGGGGGNSGAYLHIGNPGGGVSQSLTFTNPAGSIVSGGIGGQGSQAYGSGGGGGGGAGIGGGGGGGGGGYGLGGGGGGGGGGAGVGGGGGAGGYGAGGVGGQGGNVTGTASITNFGKIYGGAGAAGVNYSVDPAQHGTAGSGGDAIGYGGSGGLGGGSGGPGGVGGSITGLATTIINTGLLQGGNGGAPSPGLTTDGGVGGVGIRGSNLTIINSGTIAGGFDGNTGTVRSNAILFTGGANSLELQSGWVIAGNVGNAPGVTGTTNTLILGGSATNLSGNGTATATIFDVSQIGAQFQNFNAFQKSGASTWQLTNTTNAVTPWTITGGVLQISNDAALGNTSGTLTFGGTDADTSLPGSGTLAVTTTISTSRNVVLNNVTGFANTIDVSGTSTYTVGGTITGSGGVTKLGLGTLLLTGANTYGGGSFLDAGTIAVGNNSAVGAGTLAMADGTTLSWLSGNDYTISNAITMTATGNFTPPSGTAQTLSGVIADGSSPGMLTMQGPGTLVLTANNTYTGGTTINAGTLQVGNGGTSGSIIGNVTNNGVLAFDRSDTVTFPGVISGTGSVTQDGIGTTILTGTNTNTGGTTIDAGTLQLGNGGTSGSIVGNVTNNGALAFDRSDTVVFPGVISGAGSLMQDGAGTTILTGTNTNTGGTTINTGTLQLGNGGASGSIIGNVTNSGVLAFDRSDTVPFPGVISGTGSVTQVGAGTTILTANNTYTGGTTINAGTLQLGNGGTSGSIIGNVTNNGVLAFDRSDTVLFPGVISGTGSVMQEGAGATILTGIDTDTGGTTINAGTLQLGNDGTSGSIIGNVTDNGMLTFDHSDTVAFPGVISGAGSVTQDGAGTTILNADDTYTGATTIAKGTLVVGDATHNSAALSGSGPVTIASGATLGGFGSVAGSVTDNGTLAVGNALPAFSGGPDTTFTIGGNLTNAGLVTLSSARPGNVLVVDGSYSGNNGMLRLSTYLNAGGTLSNQITDRLLVKGDPIGDTTVVVSKTGPGAITGTPNASDGISLIQVAGGSTADAFSLAGGYVSAGGSPYQYHLNAYGPGSPNGVADPAQNLVGNESGYWDYRLQTAYVDPSGPVSPGLPTPPADARPEVVPQVPAYISAPTALFNVGFQDVDSLHRRLGEIRDAEQEGEPQQGEAFLRAYGGTFDYTSTRAFGDYGYNSAQDYAAVEFGGSGIMVNNSAGTLRVGLAGIVGRLWLTPSAIDGASDVLFNSEKLAVITTWQARIGWYLDGIVYGGMFDGTVSTAAKGEATGLNGTSAGFSLEGGWPLQLAWQKLVAEPEAQIVYQRLNFGTRTDTDGLNVDMGSLGQGIARVGGRLLRQFWTGNGTQVTPYLKLNLLQGFADGGTIDLSNIGFATGQYGTAIQAGGGITGTLTRRLAIYGDVAYQHYIGDGGFRGWTFNAGLRYDF